MRCRLRVKLATKFGDTPQSRPSASEGCVHKHYSDIWLCTLRHCVFLFLCTHECIKFVKTTL